MELVIKLGDETYKQAINRTEFDTLSLGIKLIEAVQNGTPLPKGHGDLVDRNDLSLMTVHLIDGTFVCDAQTIIEADKEK